ncbi:MAG: hypothetical protein HBSIN02_08840 [Bacteroidia bacterium]|nr:MAG: hypothetical protein HBSIN02_08840 [Bacteroidia bacterium]
MHAVTSIATRLTARNRRIALAIVVSALAFAFPALSFAQGSFRSNASGNWGTAGTWTLVSGTDADGIPDANDNVDIVNGHTVIVNVNAAVNNLTVSAGTLDIRGVTFTVNGATSVSGSLAFTTSTAGTKTFVGPITINPGGTWSHSANETVVIQGGITNNGSFSTGTGAYTFNTNSQTLAGSNPLTFGGNASITGAITVTNTTTVNVAGSVTGSVAGSTWLNDAGSTLNAAAAVMATGVLNASASPNTVNYNGGGAQTIKAATYDNLTIAKSGGTATTGGTTTVNGTFSVVSGTTAISGVTFAANGPTVIDGTLNITGAAGTKTFAGPVTLNAGAVWNNSANEAVTFQNGLTHNGTTFTAGTGVHTFDTNSQAISGSSPLTIPSVTITGVTLTNNATLTVSTALAGTGELVNASAGVLNINFTGTPSLTTLTASAPGNTVQYGAAGAQTIKVPSGSTYHHLVLATSGAKTAGGALTVNGDLTQSGSASFNAGTSLTHTLAGSWILNTTAATPFSFTTASTIVFTTPSPPAQTTIGGTTTATIALNNLTINNTAGVAVNENISFQTGTAPTLTVASGATLTPAATAIISGTTGTLTGGGTVKVTRTAVTADFLSQYTIATKDLSSLIVDYDATGAQTVNALNYFGLTIQGSRGANSVTLQSGTIGVSGAFTPAATFTSGGYAVTGNTVDFNGGGAQTVPAFGYNNLTLSNAGTKTFATGTAGILGVFTIAGSAVADATSNITTVNYNGTGAQAVLPINYHHLLLSGSGTKTFSSGTTGIAGDFTFGGTATADATTNTSTIDFNGSGNQSVPAIDYYALAFSNAGTKTLAAGTTRIAGTFTVSGTAVPDAVTNATTIEYTGSVNQNSPTMTYHNLVVNRAGIAGRLLVNDATVNNTFTILVGEARVTNATFTVLGQANISGLFRVSNANAIPVFNTIVVNTTGEIRFAANAIMTINGDLQIDGSALITSGTNTWTFQKPGGGGTIGGTTAGVTIENASFTTDYTNTGAFAFGNLAITASTLTNNGSLSVTAGLTGSGTLVQGNGSSLDLAFGGSPSVAAIDADAPGNTVTFSAAAAQTVPATNYANLSLTGSGVKTLSAGVTGVSGALTFGGTATADAMANSATVDYNGVGQTIAVMQYYDLRFSNAGTKTFGPGTTMIAGDFDITGSAAADALSNTPAIEYNGSGVQTVQALTYHDVIINNAAGVALNGTITVNNTLTLTAGTITTGSSTVVIGPAGSVSRTAGHVAGNLAKYIPTGSPTPTFEVGDGASYTPVMLSFASVSGAGTFTVSTTAGDHPQILTSSIDAAKSVNRYWTVTNSGTVFTTFDATFTFVPADVDGGASTASFIVDRYNGGTWTSPGVGTLTPTSTQATGLTAGGDFQIGELSLFVLKTWDGGAGTKNWGDANNWNPNGVPAATNNVSLTGADTITIGVAASVNSITLNNSALVVTILSGNSLSVAGDLQVVEGTLSTESAFPSVAGTVTITGGTVEYSANGAQSVALQTYHHLTLRGSGTKTFVAGTTVLRGDLTLGGSASADATSNSTTIDYAGGANQLVAAMNYHHLTLSNAGTKTFNGGTVGIAGNLSIAGSASADATTNATTVDYNGGGAQSVAAMNYYHLTLSNAGTKTFNGGIVGIAGNLSITGSASADATTNATTVDYNGGGAQSVAAMNYYHLTLSNAGTKTFNGGTVGIAGNLSITGSASADATTNATTVDYNGGGAQSVAAMNYYHLTLSNAGTKTLGAGTTGIAGTLVITGLATADATANVTTVDYNGSGFQSVALLAYNNLALSNSGTKQLSAGTTSISGDLTISGSAVLDASTNATHVNLNGAGSQAFPASDYGDLTLGGAGIKTLGPGTARIKGVFSVTGSASVDLTTNATTVEFTGTSNQDSPEITYYNLIASNTGARLLLNNVAVVNDFTVQLGQARVTGNNFTVGGITALNAELRITATGGSKTLGTVVVNTSGTLNFTAAEDLTINGDFTVNGGGTVNSNGGVWTFQKAGGGTIGGTSASVAITNAVFTTPYVSGGTYTFDNLVITGTTFTNSGSVTVTGGLAGTGSFTQGAAATLNYSSASPITVNSFNASAAGNTVRYDGASSQDILQADYYDLALDGSNAKVFGSGTTRIAGGFLVGGTATADAVTNNPTIEFNGTAAQTVEGLSFYRVTINNPAGIVLSGVMTVTNLLTLTDGVISTGSNTVTLVPGATVSRTSGHVAGNLVKTIPVGSPTVTFEIGDGSGNYTPVVTTFSGVTVGGTLTVSTTGGDHPEILSSGLEPSRTVNRYYTLIGGGIVYASYDITMNFVGGDIDGAANPSNFIVGRFESLAWSLPSIGTLTATSTQAVGVVGFGDFQIGEASSFVLKTWDGGAGTANWSDANNWNPNGVPTSSNNVNLTGAATIDVDVDANVNSITLNNSALLLTIRSGNTLTAAGDFLLAAGVMNTETTFPAVTGTVTISGGTVGYTGAAGQTVAVQSYHDLALSGSGTKTLGSGVTRLTGDFTIGGSAVADATSNAGTVEYNGGGTQSVAAIHYHHLTLTNAGSKVFQAGTVGVAGDFSIGGSAVADAITNGSTVDYNGGSGQTVRAMAYFHLVLSNAGTKTFAPGTTSIAGNLTISGSAVADATTNATTIDYDGNGGQTVGAIDYHHLALSNSGTKVFDSGTTTIAGDFTVTGTAAGDAAANATTVELNGSAAQSVSAAAFHNLSLSGGSVKILGAGTTTIAGDLVLNGGATIDAVGNSTTIDFNGSNQNIPAIDYYNVTFSNSGTKVLTSGTIRIASNLVLSGLATLDAATNAATVEFNGTINQSCSPTTLYNLVIAKSSGRLLLNDIIVTNNFNLQAGEGRLTGGSLSVAGTTTISEIFRVTSTTGSLTLGDVVVNGTGQVLFVADEDVTMNGSLQVDGGATFTSGSGLWTFQKPGGGVISGTAPALSITNAAFLTDYSMNRNVTFDGLTVTAATVTNNQTIAVTGALTGTGTITQGTGATLTLSGGVSIGNLVASAPGNTVEYVRNGDQNVLSTDYYHVTLGVSGIKTLGGGTTGIAGALVVSGTASVDAVLNAGTVDFNGSGNQSVPALDYYHLVFSNGGTKTLAGGTTQISGSFTVTGAASADLTTNLTAVSFNGSTAQSVPSLVYYDLSLIGAGDKTASGAIVVQNDFSNASVFDMLSHSLSIAGVRTNTGTIRFGGASNGMAFDGGTIEYDGSVSQTVASGTYGTLIFSGAGVKTFTANTVVLGTMTIASGAPVVVDPSVIVQIDGDLEVFGPLTNNGTLNIGS